MKIHKKIIFFFALCYSVIVSGQNTTLSVVPDELTIPLNSEDHIAIYIDSISGLRAYSVKINYDPEKLRVEGITKSNFFTNYQTFFFSQVDSSAGKITVDEAILGLGHTSGSGELFKVEFRGEEIGDVVIDYDSVQFRDTNNVSIPVQKETGLVHVVHITGIGYENSESNNFELSQYPNPFNSSTRIIFRTGANVKSEFSIYSISGEEVFKYYSSDSNIDYHWNGTDKYGNSLPSGLYILRVKNGSEFFLAKMILLK